MQIVGSTVGHRFGFDGKGTSLKSLKKPGHRSEDRMRELRRRSKRQGWMKAAFSFWFLLTIFGCMTKQRLLRMPVHMFKSDRDWLHGCDAILRLS